jgi:hypothetical protein
MLAAGGFRNRHHGVVAGDPRDGDGGEVVGPEFRRDGQVGPVAPGDTGPDDGLVVVNQCGIECR